MSIRSILGGLCMAAFTLSAAHAGSGMETAAPVKLAQAATPAATMPLIIDQPWSRATAPGARVAGGFFTLKNRGSTDDRLIGGSAEISNVVEVHEMAIIDGVMKMRALDKGLAVPAGGAVELKPGSFHIMFIDLKRQLKEGESFKGELVFEKAGKVPVEYKVMPVGSKSGASEHKH